MAVPPWTMCIRRNIESMHWHHYLRQSVGPPLSPPTTEPPRIPVYRKRWTQLWMQNCDKVSFVLISIDLKVFTALLEHNIPISPVTRLVFDVNKQWLCIFFRCESIDAWLIDARACQCENACDWNLQCNRFVGGCRCIVRNKGIANGMAWETKSEHLSSS